MEQAGKKGQAPTQLPHPTGTCGAWALPSPGPPCPVSPYRCPRPMPFALPTPSWALSEVLEGALTPTEDGGRWRELACPWMGGRQPECKRAPHCGPAGPGGVLSELVGESPGALRVALPPGHGKAATPTAPCDLNSHYSVKGYPLSLPWKSWGEGQSEGGSAPEEGQWQ